MLGNQLVGFPEDDDVGLDDVIMCGPAVCHPAFSHKWFSYVAAPQASMYVLVKGDFIKGMSQGHPANMGAWEDQLEVLAASPGCMFVLLCCPSVCIDHC